VHEAQQAFDRRDSSLERLDFGAERVNLLRRLRAVLAHDATLRSIGARRLRRIQFPKPRTSRADGAEFMTSIPFDRDHDPALDRRGRAADQAIGVFCSRFGRRLVEPPHDRRSGAPLGLRQLRESRRSLSGKEPDRETVEVENLGQR